MRLSSPWPKLSMSHWLLVMDVSRELAAIKHTSSSSARAHPSRDQARRTPGTPHTTEGPDRPSPLDGPVLDFPVVVEGVPGNAARGVARGPTFLDYLNTLAHIAYAPQNLRAKRLHGIGIREFRTTQSQA